MSDSEGTPTPAHTAGEFYVWLWFVTEAEGSNFDLGGQIGRFDLWVDDRLAFRNPDDAKVSATMTGENPARTLEARAALAGGKVLQELRLGMRRDDREFEFTLRGPTMDLVRVKLPQVVDGAEAIHDRMHLHDELVFVLAGLLARFARERTADVWGHEVLPAMRAWALAEA